MNAIYRFSHSSQFFHFYVVRIQSIQRNMAFPISKEKIGSDHQDSVETESGNRVVISSQLYLKSSSHENLDKNVVLRRLRHHKCLQKVRGNLKTLLDSYSTKDYSEHKWLEQGDVFCSPQHLYFPPCTKLSPWVSVGAVTLRVLDSRTWNQSY